MIDKWAGKSKKTGEEIHGAHGGNACSLIAYLHDLCPGKGILWADIYSSKHHP